MGFYPHHQNVFQLPARASCTTQSQLYGRCLAAHADASLCAGTVADRRCEFVCLLVFSLIWWLPGTTHPPGPEEGFPFSHEESQIEGAELGRHHSEMHYLLRHCGGHEDQSILRCVCMHVCVLQSKTKTGREEVRLRPHRTSLFCFFCSVRCGTDKHSTRWSTVTCVLKVISEHGPSTTKYYYMLSWCSGRKTFFL